MSGLTKQGSQLAAQLENLLDDTPFDISMLSRDPEGGNADGLSAARERLATFQVNGQSLELQLERVELRPGYRIWLVASDSLPLIPKAHQLVAETAAIYSLDKIVTFPFADIPRETWQALSRCFENAGLAKRRLSSISCASQGAISPWLVKICIGGHVSRVRSGRCAELSKPDACRIKEHLLWPMRPLRSLSQDFASALARFSSAFIYANP